MKGIFTASVVTFIVFHLIVGATAVYPEPEAPTSYGKKQQQFLPAKKGQNPSCLSNPRLTYCTDPDYYPEERIAYLLKNNMYDLSSFIVDEAGGTYTFEAKEEPRKVYTPKPLPRKPYSGYLPPPPGPSHHYSQRPSVSKVANAQQNQRYKRQVLQEGPSGSTTDLCPSRSSYIMPRAARSVRGDWMYLVNLQDNSDNFTQLVRSEICIQNRCSGSCNAPPGTEAICQQQFVQKRLVALKEDGGRLSQDVFWFPSCCLCKIRRL